MQKVLICLNSAQVIQNVIAVLNVEPDRVVIFTTTDVGVQLKQLRTALSLIGWSLSDEDIHDIHPTRFNDIDDTCNRWLAAQDHNQEYILNATGGTKPMSLIAGEVFRNLPHFSAIYIDSDKDQTITRFYPHPYQSAPIRHFPSIETYLAAYGFRMGSLSDPIDPVPYAPLWEYGVCSFKQMNWLLKSLPRNPAGCDIYTAGNPRRLETDLNLLKRVGIIEDIRPTGAAGRFTIVYSREKAVTSLIINNGWLEEYLAWTLKRLGFDEVRRGVKIIPPFAPATFAEFDVIARKGARLYMFECKTGSYPVSQEIIHAIESKVRMAGVFLLCRYS